MAMIKSLASALGSLGISLAVAYPLGLTSFVWLSYGINLLAWIPATIGQTEHYYDLTGTITFMAVVLASHLSPSSSVGLDAIFESVESKQHEMSSLVSLVQPFWRDWLSTAMILGWTLRLGFFLFKRIGSVGKDDRFDGVRDQPSTFLLYWAVQAQWVFFSCLPTLIRHHHQPLQEEQQHLVAWSDVVGVVVWLLGIAAEVLADQQKSAFKADQRNKGKFCDAGLWRFSRHPNYVGEMTLWLGIFVMNARGAYPPTGSGLARFCLAALGPAFIISLITFVSAPQTEEKGEDKYGASEAYQEYKRCVPVLVGPVKDRKKLQ